MKAWLSSHKLDPDLSDTLIENADDLSTLLTFTEEDLRDLAKEMKLNIGRRRKLLNAVRAGWCGRNRLRLTDQSAAMILRSANDEPSTIILRYQQPLTPNINQSYI